MMVIRYIILYTIYQRCVGLRHLYPVFCIPEVEINPSKATSMDTVDYCESLVASEKIDYYLFHHVGLRFIERCGKTGFFRSGPEPLILSDSERERRRQGLQMKDIKITFVQLFLTLHTRGCRQAACMGSTLVQYIYRMSGGSETQEIVEQKVPMMRYFNICSSWVTGLSGN
jgi:hypothetical protein